MKKRTMCLLLAAVMAAGLMLPVSAAGVAGEEEVSQVVGALNIMVGDEHGNLNLEREVTRAEFITMAVKATPQGDKVGQASTSPYPDVPRTHWSAGFVQTGVQMGLIAGYLDGTFKPDNKITLAEGATIVLKLLGYTSGDFVGSYPTAQMTMYHSLELDRGLNAVNSGDVLCRRDAMYLFYNLLSTKNKSGQYHLTTLGHSLNAAGEVDRAALLGEVMEGPIVAGEGWQKQIPFGLDTARVTRAGKTSKVDAIQNGDLIYWSEGLGRLWVYTDRVTGTIQMLSPSAANPTSVNVAGQTYAIEHEQAAFALSDLGKYRLGDTVTVVLGRKGGVAAVLSPSAGELTKVGIVTAVNKSSYSGSNGTSYTADTITMQATDGKFYSYPWNSGNWKVGDLIQAVVASDNSVSLKRLGKVEALGGTVSADGQKLGSRAFADDVLIMDTYEGKGIRVYPSRLAGVILTEEKVRYYTLNALGQIQHLILEDVTGDMHQYGVMTGVQNLSYAMNVLVNYVMDLKGQTTVFTSQNTVYPVEEGPFVLMGAVNDPDMIRQLTEVKVDRLEGRSVVSQGISHPILDGVAVYEFREDEYYLSNLDRVSSGYQLTAWYDETAARGGGVRVIIAKELP